MGEGKVLGSDLLKLTAETLMQGGIPMGPAAALASRIRELQALLMNEFNISQ